MEFVIIFVFASAVVYLSSTKMMSAFRIRYAPLIFFIGYPVFFYFVVFKDFSWIKLLVFILMLSGSLYTYLKEKAKLNPA